MSNTEYIKSLAEQLKREQTRAHPFTSVDASTATVRKAIIYAANTAGGVTTYDVTVVSPTGSAADSIRGCSVWGSASLSVGDKVWIMYEGNRPIPYILSSSSAGSSGGWDYVPVIVSKLGFNG
jgi:hypothetical protein